jgi:hypothetical protein
MASVIRRKYMGLCFGWWIGVVCSCAADFPYLVAPASCRACFPAEAALPAGWFRPGPGLHHTTHYCYGIACGGAHRGCVPHVGAAPSLAMLQPPSNSSSRPAQSTCSCSQMLSPQGLHGHACHNAAPMHQLQLSPAACNHAPGACKWCCRARCTVNVCCISRD